MAVRSELTWGNQTFQAYSNWFELTLIKIPFIYKMWPASTPTGETRTIGVWGANLKEGNTVLWNNVLHLPLVLHNQTYATFETPKNYLEPGYVSVELTNKLQL